jgi:hypothetical protein
MTILCIALMAWGLGLFTAFFLYGWLEERDDRYSGLVVPHNLGTCINWELRMRAIRRAQR